MVRILTLLFGIQYALIAQALWQCPAFDKYGKFYIVQNPYIKITVHKSLDLCKKKSKVPSSCFVERAFCNLVEKSGVPKAYWNCFAFDYVGERYSSGPYKDKYQASLSAESLCQRLSKSPATCNVPQYTCEKI